MHLFERQLEIAIPSRSADVLGYFGAEVARQLGSAEVPVRFAVTRTTATHFECELGVMAGGVRKRRPPSIFAFTRRPFEAMDTFTAVLLVPTGIGAEIGGHAGDAGPVAKLLASASDRLITHPNVVNASDINELPENGLYVEGSTICRLLMGTVALQPVRQNRVLFVLDAHPDGSIGDRAINALNAARACFGLDCRQVIQLDPTVRLTAEYSSSGRATGRVDRLEHLLDVIEGHTGEFDALALATTVDLPPALHSDYFHANGAMVNPWGGVEAILTHAVSLLYDLPSAHSPMPDSKEVQDEATGVVDARLAAEAVSYTYLNSIFKGLQKSPRIVTDPSLIDHPALLSAANVSVLVIPDGCVGLPVIAALQQQIPVIGVRENRNLMRNDTAALPWSPGQYHVVDNYLEAAGLIVAMKAGIAVESVRRPLRLAPVAVPVAAAVASPMLVD